MKISVIIPIYKVEPYLRQCLDSIIHQSYRNLEILLIDDGSPDGCGRICDEYATRDSRISVIHKQNQGLCAARNDGIQMATGDWIAFVDSDDWCELDYYQHFADALESQKVDIFFSRGYFREEPKKSTVVYNFSQPFWLGDRVWIKEHMHCIFPFAQFEGQTIRSSYGLPWDKLYRTSFLRKNGLFFDPTTRAYEDYQFNLKAFALADAIGGCSCIGYHYRQVATSIGKGFSPGKPMANYDYITKVHQLIEEYLPTNPLLRQAVGRHTLDIIKNACQCYYFHPANKTSYGQIAKEISDMKQWDFFHRVIWSNENEGISIKQRIFKLSLRLPWLWPFKLLYWANQTLQK